MAFLQRRSALYVSDEGLSNCKTVSL
jgi:hypothetical protein